MARSCVALALPVFRRRCRPANYGFAYSKTIGLAASINGGRVTSVGWVSATGVAPSPAATAWPGACQPEAGRTAASVAAGGLTAAVCDTSVASPPRS